MTNNQYHSKYFKSCLPETTSRNLPSIRVVIWWSWQSTSRNLLIQTTNPNSPSLDISCGFKTCLNKPLMYYCLTKTSVHDPSVIKSFTTYLNMRLVKYFSVFCRINCFNLCYLLSNKNIGCFDQFISSLHLQSSVNFTHKSNHLICIVVLGIFGSFLRPLNNSVYRNYFSFVVRLTQ